MADDKEGQNSGIVFGEVIRLIFTHKNYETHSSELLPGVITPPKVLSFSDSEIERKKFGGW